MKISVYGGSAAKAGIARPAMDESDATGDVELIVGVINVYQPQRPDSLPDASLKTVLKALSLLYSHILAIEMKICQERMEINRSENCFRS